MTDSTAPRPLKSVSTEDLVAELECRRREIVLVYATAGQMDDLIAEKVEERLEHGEMTADQRANFGPDAAILFGEPWCPTDYLQGELDGALESHVESEIASWLSSYDEMFGKAPAKAA